MPPKCKSLFLRSMQGELAKQGEDLTPDERNFLSVKRELTDFNIGLVVPGKLLPKRIRGGVLLTPTTYEMRWNKKGRKKFSQKLNFTASAFISPSNIFIQNSLS